MKALIGSGGGGHSLWAAAFAVMTTFVVMLAGCAAKRPVSGFRAFVDAKCITAPIILEQCDFQVEPPRCAKIKLSYKRGCEQIDASKAVR